MAFTKGTGGDWFKPAAGRYIGKFISYEDGPTVSGKEFKQPDGSTRVSEPVTMIRWKFELRNTSGEAVIDPKTGLTAIGEGLSSPSIGFGDKSTAKARRWLKALYASANLVFDDSLDAEEIVNKALGASGILEFDGEGKLTDVSPLIVVGGGVS